MSTITVQNGRLHSDIRAHVALKDSGVAIDWTGLTEIRAFLRSDAQGLIAGKFTVAVNQSDPTDLVCDYAANDPQYEGLNRIIVRCVYEGRTKTYDAPVINLVPFTADLADDPVVLEDPEVDVSIEVTEVSTSLLDEAIQAALDAAEAADAAAALANEKAGDADDAALLANQKAQLADDAALLASQKAQLAAEAADLANQKAQLANQKAQLAAEQAALAAEKAQAAQEAADLANQKAALAAEKAQAAQDAADLANQKAQLADDAAGNANTKAALANTKAGYAQDQGDYAKAQGDYAKDQIDGAKGDFESLNDRFNHVDEISVTLDETTDPADAEYQDEYQRVLRVLYQAIIDAKAAIEATEGAKFDADTAAGSALSAAMEALRQAGSAEEAARTARTAAQQCQQTMDEASGPYGSLNERLNAIEAGKQDVIEDLGAIRTGAAAGSTAYQKPEGGVPSSDMSSGVQTSLGKADSALQPSDVKPVATSGDYEDLTNKPGNLSDFSNNVAVTFEESSDPSSLID